MHLNATIGRRAVVALIAASTALFAVSAASATLFGAYSLTYGSCCSNATLDGTRAYIDTTSDSPDASNCIAFASAVTSHDSSAQLQTGRVRCGSNTNVDGTCSLSNNLVFHVERIPAAGGTPTCYPHGAASLNSNDLFTVDDSAGNGTWQTYIDGTLHEGQSGYDNTLGIEEWGEYTGTSCSGWSTGSSITSWQRYNYPTNAWTTVGSATPRNDGCWSVGTLTSGNFSLGH